MNVYEETPVVVRDVFPAQVQVGDDVFHTRRAVVTRERVYLYEGRGRERVLTLSEPYVAEQSTIPRYNAPPRQETRLVLAKGASELRLAGAVLTIRRQSGCGCSSPLKAWHPWQPYRVAAL